MPGAGIASKGIEFQWNNDSELVNYFTQPQLSFPSMEEMEMNSIDSTESWENKKKKSCVINTTVGYVIMYIQNDVLKFKNII